MRTWQRTVTNTKCGNCPTVIVKGERVQVVTLPGVKRTSFRCEACATEVVGAVVSNLGGFARPQLVTALPFDYKSAQVGED